MRCSQAGTREKLAGRRQRKVLVQVLDDEQLRSMAGGEEADWPIVSRRREGGQRRIGCGRDLPCFIFERKAKFEARLMDVHATG